MYKNFKVTYIDTFIIDNKARMQVEVSNTRTNEHFIDTLYSEKQVYQYFVKLYSDLDSRFG